MPNSGESFAEPSGNGIVGYEDCIRNVYATNHANSLADIFDESFKLRGYITLDKETLTKLLRLAIDQGIAIGQMEIAPINTHKDT